MGAYRSTPAPRPLGVGCFRPSSLFVLIAHRFHEQRLKPSEAQGRATLIIANPSGKPGGQGVTEAAEHDGGKYFAHRVGGIFESPTFAVPELLRSHAHATETNKDCPLHGGSSGNAYTVTYKTEDT